MNFVLSVIHPVDDVEQAAHFFEHTLGFHERSVTHDGVQLGNGALTVRLVPCTGPRVPGVLEIEMETRDLQEATAQLRAAGTLRVLQGEAWVTPERMEMRCQGPYGVCVTLARTFNEDELGILPELPVQLTWAPEADACLKQILRFVPVAFRGIARRRVTERAEQLTLAAGKRVVEQPLALRALVQSTPAFQHQRLQEELRSAGIDPEPLFAAL